MVPNRVFVGGIATSTTEAELQELFSLYGHVTNTKIIVDRAGVSKGYGFVTFETAEGAQRALMAGNNLTLRDRRLNVAPAIKKQPFTSRAYAPHHGEPVQQAAPAGHVVYHQDGVPYMYHNGTAFFHHADTFYQYASQAAAQNLQASSAAMANTSSPTTTAGGYPIVYQPYYPQQAFQYPNAWSAPNGQWRWAPPGGSGGTPSSPSAVPSSSSPLEPEGGVHSAPPQPYLAAGHPAASQPAYFYPTLLSPGANQSPNVEGPEYHDPAIVETGSEVPRELAPPQPAPAPAPLLPLLELPSPFRPPSPEPFWPRHHPHPFTWGPAHHRWRSSPVAHGSSAPANGATPHPLMHSSPLRTVPRVVNGTPMLATPNSMILPNVAAPPGWPVGVTVSSARRPRLPLYALSAPDPVAFPFLDSMAGTADWQQLQCHHSAP